MDYRRIFRLNKKQFDYKIDREGHTIYNYSKDKDEKVFFSKTSSNKPSQDKLTIYFDANASIDKGDVLRFRDEYYIALNENYPENDVWRSSLLIKCNTVWNLFGEVVPFVSCDLSSPNPSNGMVSGVLNFYTKDIPLLHTHIGIGDKFYDFGGCYDLVNKFYIDGLAYLYFKRDVHNQNVDYFIQDAHNSAYIVDKTRAKFYLGSSTSGYYLPTADIKYTSSDEDIAVIEDGVIIPKQNGNVVITATTDYVFDYGEKIGNPKQYTESFEFVVNMGGEDLDGYTLEVTKDGNGWTFNSGNMTYVDYVVKKDGEIITMDEVPTATFTVTVINNGVVSGTADASQHITVYDEKNQERNDRFYFSLANDDVTQKLGGDILRITLTFSNGLSGYVDSEIHIW